MDAFLQSPCGATSAFQKMNAFSFMFMLTFCTNDNVIAPLWHFIFQWYLQKLQMTFVKCPIWIGCINKFAFRSFSEKCFLNGFPQKCQNWWMLRQIRSGVSLKRERKLLCESVFHQKYWLLKSRIIATINEKASILFVYSNIFQDWSP